MVPLADNPLVRRRTCNRLRVRTTLERQFWNGCRTGKGISQSPRPTSPVEQIELPLNGVLNHSSSSSRHASGRDLSSSCYSFRFWLFSLARPLNVPRFG